jgi:ATP-dependent Zn protease
MLKKEILLILFITVLLVSGFLNTVMVNNIEENERPIPVTPDQESLFQKILSENFMLIIILGVGVFFVMVVSWLWFVVRD